MRTDLCRVVRRVSRVKPVRRESLQVLSWPAGCIAACAGSPRSACNRFHTGHAPTRSGARPAASGGRCAAASPAAAARSACLCMRVTSSRGKRGTARHGNNRLQRQTTLQGTRCPPRKAYSAHGPQLLAMRGTAASHCSWSGARGRRAHRLAELRKVCGSQQRRQLLRLQGGVCGGSTRGGCEAAGWEGTETRSKRAA